MWLYVTTLFSKVTKYTPLGDNTPCNYACPVRLIKVTLEVALCALSDSPVGEESEEPEKQPTEQASPREKKGKKRKSVIETPVPVKKKTALVCNSLL